MEISQLLTLVGSVAVMATLSILTIATLTLLSALTVTMSARTHSIHETMVEQDGEVRYKVRFPLIMSGWTRNFCLRIIKYFPVVVFCTYLPLCAGFILLPYLMLSYDGVVVAEKLANVNCDTGVPSQATDKPASVAKDECTVAETKIMFRSSNEMPVWVANLSNINGVATYLVIGALAYAVIMVAAAVASRLMMSFCRSTPLTQSFYFKIKDGKIDIG